MRLVLIVYLCVVALYFKLESDRAIAAEAAADRHASCIEAAQYGAAPRDSLALAEALCSR